MPRAWFLFSSLVLLMSQTAGACGSLMDGSPKPEEVVAELIRLQEHPFELAPLLVWSRAGQLRKLSELQWHHLHEFVGQRLGDPELLTVAAVSGQLWRGAIWQSGEDDGRTDFNLPVDESTLNLAPVLGQLFTLLQADPRETRAGQSSWINHHDPDPPAFIDFFGGTDRHEVKRLHPGIEEPNVPLEPRYRDFAKLWTKYSPGRSGILTVIGDPRGRVATSSRQIELPCRPRVIVYVGSEFEEHLHIALLARWATSTADYNQMAMPRAKAPIEQMWSSDMFYLSHAMLESGADEIFRAIAGALSHWPEKSVPLVVPVRAPGAAKFDPPAPWALVDTIYAEDQRDQPVFHVYRNR